MQIPDRQRDQKQHQQIHAAAAATITDTCRITAHTPAVISLGIVFCLLGCQLGAPLDGVQYLAGVYYRNKWRRAMSR